MKPSADPRPEAKPPRISKYFHQSMDTGRLLLAFLAFGAACTTLWAWMLANTGGNSTAVVTPARPTPSRIRQ